MDILSQAVNRCLSVGAYIVYDRVMDNLRCEANGKRACVKIAVVVAAIMLVLAAMVAVVHDGQVLDELKHSLSLWTIVALVVIINLVSFLCFVVLYAAYRWVRRDLKPRRDDDLDI